MRLPDIAWKYGRDQALADSDVPLGGPGVCAWSGQPCEETWPFRPSDGFADWGDLGAPDSPVAHPGYAWMANHHRAPAGRSLGFRRFSILAHPGGVVMAGKDEKHVIRGWFLTPPNPPFAVLVADQGQKHFAWRTPAALDRSVYPVRFDDRVATITPAFRDLITATDHLYAAGLSKADMQAGETTVARLMRLTPGERRMWGLIRSWRGQVELGLAVWLAQKPEETA